MESPAKTKTLKKFLGPGFDVDSSVGHIRDLPAKEMGFDLETLKPNYVVNPDKKQVVGRLRKKTKAASKVLLATDLDREGESIAWHLKQALGLKNKPYGRIVFSEITKTAVQNALQNERDINMSFVAAQETRRLLDRFVGYTVSPWLSNTLPGNGRLSGGRVQTVALMIVCNRFKEIENFIPETYFVIKAQLNSDGSEWSAQLEPESINIHALDKKENTNVPKGHLVSEYHAQRISDFLLESKTLSIVDVEEKESKSKAPAPFTTSSLQQAASNALSFNPKLTMSVAQSLYEDGLITYMRTDTTNLSSEAVDSIRLWLSKYQEAQQIPGKIIPDTPNTFTSKADAQEAHEAIRPSDFFNMGRNIEGRTEQEKQRKVALYQLIWKRAVASQMMPAVYDKTVITLRSAIDPDNGNSAYLLKASGSVLKEKGWRILQAGDQTENDKADGSTDDKQNLPIVRKGDKPLIQSANAERRQTKPPGHYTEASLVKALEKEGVGRPSTYASTIDTLLKRKYVVSTTQKGKKKILLPTELGVLVVDTVANKFKFADIGYTKRIEGLLDDIKNQKTNIRQVLPQEIKQLQSEVEALGGIPDYKPKQAMVVKEVCPSCEEGKLIAREGRSGPFAGCSNYPKCKHTEQM